MLWFQLLSASFTNFIQTVLRKSYTLKSRNNLEQTVLFNLFLSLAALVSLAVIQIIGGKPMSFHLPTMLYSLMFAVSFTLAITFMNLSVANGLLGITTLIISYSLMIPTLFGLVIFKTPIGVFAIIGIVLLAASLFLIGKPKSSSVKHKIQVKWVIFVIIATLANGGCSVSQQLHQAAFPGEYRLELLEFSMIFVSLSNLIIYLVRFGKPRRDSLREYALTACFAGVSGVANALCNFLVVTLVTVMSSALIYPVISASGILMTFLLSVTVYREKYTILQYIGILFGTASLVFLNL